MKIRTTFHRGLTGLVAGGLMAGAGLALAPGAAFAATAGTGTAGTAASAGTSGAPAPKACSPSELALAQAAVGKGLTNRVSFLNALTGAVGSAKGLTTGDKGTLSTDLQNELSGIQSLQQKVPGDTTCAQVAADGKAMVTDYRVYVVMGPQVHLTIAADTETAVAGEFQAVEPKIQAAITAAKSAGKNVTAAQAAFTDLQAQVTTAQQDSSGISATVLAFTPASYPGCTATFTKDHTTLHAGSTALHQANTDLHTIIKALH